MPSYPFPNFRARRFEIFIKTVELSPSKKLLDIGGFPELWEGSGYESQVTILNINKIGQNTSLVRFIEGDACEMRMFGDNQFDIVYSNSVIEHVGNFEKQQLMAEEIRRVGRKYWVQTPNKYFPVEVHFLFPFFQFFPKKVRHRISQVWPFSFAKFYGLDPIKEADSIWPLSIKDMRTLFPESEIIKERICGLTKSIIAVAK